LITSPKEFRGPSLPPLVADALAGQDDYHALAAYLSSRAELAYKKPMFSRPRIFDEGGRNFSSFERWNISAFGYTQGGYAFISFRGTQSFLDWLVDFNFIPWSWPLRHMGFHCAWRLVRWRIVDWIKNLPADSRNLVLTGHSLGGALAVMAAFNLAQWFPVRFVFTFGQPRVGMLIFSQNYNSRSCGPGRFEKLGAITRRYMHETDLVPRLPPLLLYWHVGDRWLLDSSGNCNQGRPKWLIRRLEDSFYDWQLKSMTSSDQKTAAPQNVDWSEALDSATGRSSPSRRTPPKFDAAQDVRDPQSQERRFFLWPETWKTIFSNLHWLIAAPASVIGTIVGLLMCLSYKRDVEAHFSEEYVAAFHKKYPLLFRLGDIDPRTIGR
jgi:hypothetical protein